MGVEGAPPSETQTLDIRTRVNNKVDDIGLDEVDTVDLQKIRIDDNYVSKFFKHTFDLPGEQEEAAANMIINTLKWRKEFGAGCITEADFTPTMLEKGSLFSHNRDKDGKKLLIFCVGKHVKGQEKMEDMKKFFVYFLERLNREERGDQITVMFDCRGAGLKNMDMEFVQFIIGTMKDYYPDPLNYILVFEMPWVLNAAFKVIKAWLPPAAVKKIKFLTKSNMGEYVNDDNRLEEWGGSDPWQYQFEHETSENGMKEAFEDARDEVRKKTVTFASPSPVMVQSASQDSLGSALSQTSGVGSNTAGSSQVDILRLSPGQEVIFSNTAAGDLAGKIQIQNVSTKVVGYKIKTTSPEKYRVRPSTGSLGPGLSATVEIHVSGGQPTLPSSLVRDKFLITAVFLESIDLGQQQLTEALKTSRPDGQYRLRCQLAGSVAEQVGLGGGGGLAGLGHTGSVVGTGEPDSGRQVASILKKVNQLANRQEELATQLRLCLHIELVLVGLVIILLVTLLFFTNSGDCSRLVSEVSANVSADIANVKATSREEEL